MVNWKTFLLTWCILLPPLFILILIGEYGVNVPFYDQWELVPLIQNYHNGNLSLSDLWAQHNEHRLFFPRLVMLGLAILTHWNIIAELLMNLFLAILIYLTIAFLLKNTFQKNNQKIFYFLLIFSSFLIFSPVQWENWLWGWEIQWFLLMLSVLITLCSLTTWPKKYSNKLKMPISILSGTVASFSFASGLLIWPVGALIIFLQEKWSKNFFLWLAIGTLSIMLYLHGYFHPPSHPSELTFIQVPWDFLKFLWILFGAPLGPSLSSAAIIGMIILTLFFVSTFSLFSQEKKYWLKALPWMGIGLFILLSGILIDLGRLGFSIEAAKTSRYTTGSILFIISTLVITVISSEHFLRKIPHRAKITRVVISLFLLFLMTSHAMSFFASIPYFPQFHERLAQLQLCLSKPDLNEDDPCLEYGYPNKKIIKERHDYLKKIHWGGTL